MVSEKELFLQNYEREHATTVKVMKNFPESKLDFKPAEKSMSARDLLWLFAGEEMTLLGGAIKGKIEFTGMPKAPATMNEILATFEKAHAANVELIKAMPESDLETPIDFFVAPKTPGKMPKKAIMWLSVMDQVHHRGQLSVYLRIVGAKVPSIYGPSADEPWM